MKAFISFNILLSGLQLNVSDVWKLFAAIAIHAVAILFSIGAEMVYSGTKRLQVTVFNYHSFKFSSFKKRSFMRIYKKFKPCFNLKLYKNIKGTNNIRGPVRGVSGV